MGLMKTITKIDPEKEYENAKKMIELATQKTLDVDNASSLDSSVDNLITVARVLIEREERRRGPKKYPKENKPKGRNKGEARAETKKLPSERYPDLEVKEDVVRPDKNPTCPCCNKEMKESGLFDCSEKLETIPQFFYILRTKRPKFNCGSCHGAMVNTPAPVSIIPSSNYGDSMIIDVALTKYCDLLPIERYVQIAARLGLVGLPAQSLVGLTHQLANFLRPVYELIKLEVLSSAVLRADETTHKMLEGDETSQWYLWGFFSEAACYFETHGTRSGDVVIEFLKGSKTEVLMSDGYAAYSKAAKAIRKLGRELLEVHCNAHAVRYFKQAGITWKEEVEPYLALYGEIYELESTRKEKKDELSRDEQQELRSQMLPLFERIKELAEKDKEEAMAESGFKMALNYFLNHYEGLTACSGNIDIPLDNNLAEREIRGPVVGRKTWYGTHSKKGAKTTAVLFSIVQSCKLNNVNPRSYFAWIVERLHRGESAVTPYSYSKLDPPSG